MKKRELGKKNTLFSLSLSGQLFHQNVGKVLSRRNRFVNLKSHYFYWASSVFCGMDRGSIKGIDWAFPICKCIFEKVAQLL